MSAIIIMIPAGTGVAVSVCTIVRSVTRKTYPVRRTTTVRRVTVRRVR